MAAGSFPVTDDEVWWAREQMRAGHDLCEVAEDIGCEPDALDIAMWNRLGSSLEAA